MEPRRLVADAVVVGAGVMGLWAALDLASRGARVVVLEKALPGSGTSGRFHGLLHSGARYAVTDPRAARECIAENMLLRRLMPHAVEETGGFFVALTREEERYYEQWAEALSRNGIPMRELGPGEARSLEPLLPGDARVVAEVPDAVIYSTESLASIALTAHLDYNTVLIFESEVYAVERRGDTYTVKARGRGGSYEVEARAVANAAGAWAPRIASLAGYRLEASLVAGALLAYRGPLPGRVLNRLRPPSDGDIIVPYGGVALAGTTAREVSSPSPRPELWEIDLIRREAAALAPALAAREPVSVFEGVRLLEPGRGGREATRDYRVVLHSAEPAMASLVGGKYTTARLAAEALVDALAPSLGLPGTGSTATLRLRGVDPLSELHGLAPARARLFEETRGSMEERRLRAAVYEALLEEAWRRSVEEAERLLG